MKRTFGLICRAFASAPFEIATKNGLPSEPSVTPTLLSSLACAAVASRQLVATRAAMRERRIILMLSPVWL